MLFLSTASPAYKDEVLALSKKEQENALGFLKAHELSAVAVGTALKALRQLQKQGKLDEQVAQFHELVDSAVVVDPTPPSALPTFIRLLNSLHNSHNGT
ncbi:hypothetical protein PC114_g3689 [Phytophthora cactorum]|nr:hypothetical protein PC117_g16167 [Phytophthora cactorum]KAG2926760.1 hypothetical protein PC114_g3689 [Phytophthora cactorum]KAG3191295.1 hypothetical protein C6341_g1226 [Phytophthora cactorum]